MAGSTQSSSREEKRAERLTQILDAARACVLADGFHGASLSSIAAQAAMSGGHIYQYFETKEAIMIALCERDFEDFLPHLAQLSGYADRNIDAVVETFSKELMGLLSHDRAALTLEIIAEAGRNPKFLDLVLRVDDRIRDAIRDIVEPLLAGLTPQEIDERIETLLVMTRGLAVHTCTRPASDYALLTTTYKIALRGALSRSEHPESQRGAK